MKLPKVISAPEWRSANTGRVIGWCGSNLKGPKYIGAVIDGVGELPFAGEVDEVGEFPFADGADEVGELPFADGADEVGELPFADKADEVGELPFADGAADTADPTLVFPTDAAN